MKIRRPLGKRGNPCGNLSTFPKDGETYVIWDGKYIALAYYDDLNGEPYICAYPDAGNIYFDDIDGLEHWTWFRLPYPKSSDMINDDEDVWQDVSLPNNHNDPRYKMLGMKMEMPEHPEYAHSRIVSKEYWRDTAHKLSEENIELKAKLDKAKDGLYFYMDIGLYEGVSLGVAPINDDRGQRARTTLEEIK